MNGQVAIGTWLLMRRRFHWTTEKKVFLFVVIAIPVLIPLTLSHVRG